MKDAWIIGVLLACGIASAETDPRLKEFARLKREQTEELAAKLQLDLPQEARDFFQAAEAGDWVAVSNCFERIRPRAAPTDPPIPLPGLDNVLFVPILETFGAYEQFQRWDGTMLQKYASGILDSLPPGGVIYVGGSNPGVFVLRAVRDVAQSPDIFIISLNGLQDVRFMQHMRMTYGGRVWIPNQEEIQDAFHRYIEELHRAQQSGEPVKGATGAMGTTSSLSKLIFDRNKDEHEFYVEESFVIPWMYPYLEPHGLIMKLNKQPLAQFDPAVVAEHRQYWEALTKELLADPKFLGNEWARQTFAKLRSAIAGLYAYRHLIGEAEAAFKQALELCPTSPEANFRLAQLYVEQNRHDDAVAVLEQYEERLSPGFDREKALQAIRMIREMKRKAEKTK